MLDRDSVPLTAANRPPVIIPFCASCDMPVEEFTTYPATADGTVCVEAKCHGMTKGVFITRAEAEFNLANNRKLVLFPRKDGFNLVR